MSANSLPDFQDGGLAKYHGAHPNGNSARMEGVPLMQAVRTRQEDELTNPPPGAPTTPTNTEPARSDEEPLQSRRSAAARRALAEAQERRRSADVPLPPEVNGRGGLEPVRYGDWEVKGLASDF